MVVYIHVLDQDLYRGAVYWSVLCCHPYLSSLLFVFCYPYVLLHFNFFITARWLSRSSAHSHAAWEQGYWGLNDPACVSWHDAIVNICSSSKTTRLGKLCFAGNDAQKSAWMCYHGNWNFSNKVHALWVSRKMTFHAMWSCTQERFWLHCHDCHCPLTLVCCN